MAVHQIAEHSPQWHAIRKQNIGGSEIAGLLRFQADYQLSAYSLFMVKSGRIPPPPVDDSPGSRIWFGVKLEAIIAEMAAELHGWKIAKGGYCTDDETPGMACSLDYLITEPGLAERSLGFTGPGVLQIKNIDWFQHKRTWTHDEPPPHINAQLQHEIACSGCTWGAIVGMVGGNELPVYHYSARPKLIAQIRAAVTEFWQRVGDARPPLIDGSDSTTETLQAMFAPDDDDRMHDLTSDNELPEICAGLDLATEDRKTAAKNEQEFKNRLYEKMAGRKHAICSGWKIKGVRVKPNKGVRAGDMPPDEIVGARKGYLYHTPKEFVGAQA